MLWKLWDEFRRIAEPPRATDDCVVNYVWINAEPIAKTEDPNTPLCGIPLRYLDKALKNARKYPDAKVFVWVDYKLLDDMSRFFIESHVYISAPPNVQIRDLNDIPQYRSQDLFKAKTLASIWARVDLARLLVMEYLFNATEFQKVFYTDFDVDDVMLTCPFMHQALEQHDMFIGTAGTCLENGYIAFKRGPAMHFLSHKLIPKTIDMLPESCDGYRAFRGSISDWFVQQSIHFYTDKISAKRLPHLGYKISDNQDYIDWGINQSTPNQSPPSV